MYIIIIIIYIGSSININTKIKMKINSKLKNLLIRIIIAAILFLAKQYINLDNDLVDKIIIIIISAFLLDFNTFSLEITKVFFNGDEGEGSNRQNNNTPDEGEGSNRQNNNTPNQDSSISLEKDLEKELKEIFLKAELALEEEQIKEEMERKNYWKKLSETDGAEREELVKAEEARVKASAERLNADELEVFLNQREIDLMTEYKARKIDYLEREERIAKIEKKIEDLEDLENQSQPDESLINETKRQIMGSIQALKAINYKIDDKIDDYNDKVKGLILHRTKLAAQRLESSINERNNK